VGGHLSQCAPLTKVAPSSLSLLTLSPLHPLRGVLIFLAGSDRVRHTHIHTHTHTHHTLKNRRLLHRTAESHWGCITVTGHVKALEDSCISSFRPHR
jgi:hypothetical protein